MPSSHSATVTALATAIGLQDGLGGSDFAMALILACIVSHDFLYPFDAGRNWDEHMKLSKMIRSKYSPSVSEVLWSKNYFISRIDYDFWQVTYDATGVRLHAGRQAEVWCFRHPVSFSWHFSVLVQPASRTERLLPPGI